MTAIAAAGYKKIIELIKNKHGQGMAEYVLIIAFIAMVVVIGLTPVGPAISAKFAEMVNILNGS